MSNNPFSTGQFNVTPPTLTDGQVAVVQLDVNGNLKTVTSSSNSATNPLPVGGVSDSGKVVPVHVDPFGNVEVVVQNEPGVRVLDTTGEPLLATDTALNVHLKTSDFLSIDPSGNLNVTLASGVAVTNFPASQAVTGTVTANQGTSPWVTADSTVGSNTSQIAVSDAAIALNTQYTIQILNALNAILAQLKLLNLNLASSMPSAHVDSDTYLMDSFPTLQ
jgi:hypothetical protein